MALLRLITIIRTVRKYRISDCLQQDQITDKQADRGQRLKMCLTDLGPVFIKLGQINQSTKPLRD